ncbi:hypothetical protein IGI04_002260, partial [Brassica rapa subsp. trilocularis]
MATRNRYNFSSSVLVDDGSWPRCGRYGGSNPFSSERHRVQAVPGSNKCAVLVVAEGKASADTPRQAVLEWVIIFKSESLGRPKLPGSRLSVELGSFFRGKLLLRTWWSFMIAIL